MSRARISVGDYVVPDHHYYRGCYFRPHTRIVGRVLEINEVFPFPGARRTVKEASVAWFLALDSTDEELSYIQVQPISQLRCSRLTPAPDTVLDDPGFSHVPFTEIGAPLRR